MRNLTVLLCLGFTALLVGCAGSPAVLMSMSEEELKSVSNGSLCRAYNRHNTYFDSGSDWEIQNEVRRRGVNCGGGSSKSSSSTAAETELGLELMKQGMEMIDPPRQQNEDGFRIGPDAKIYNCKNDICVPVN